MGNANCCNTFANFWKLNCVSLNTCSCSHSAAKQCLALICLFYLLIEEVTKALVILCAIAEASFKVSNIKRLPLADVIGRSLAWKWSRQPVDSPHKRAALVIRYTTYTRKQHTLQQYLVVSCHPLLLDLGSPYSVSLPSRI